MSPFSQLNLGAKSRIMTNDEYILFVTRNLKGS